MEKILDIKELAAYLRTTVRGIQVRRSRGQDLPPAKIIGGKLFWREVDVQDWINRQFQASSPTPTPPAPGQRRRGRPRKAAQEG